jgi:hypothetical protein
VARDYIGGIYLFHKFGSWIGTILITHYETLEQLPTTTASCSPGWAVCVWDKVSLHRGQQSMRVNVANSIVPAQQRKAFTCLQGCCSTAVATAIDSDDFRVSHFGFLSGRVGICRDYLREANYPKLCLRAQLRACFNLMGCTRDFRTISHVPAVF